MAVELEMNSTKKSTGLKDCSGFKLDMSLSKTQRIAAFLDWAAVHQPMKYMPFNVILKVIEGYKHLPQLNNKEVEFVRSAMSRVRGILLKKYKRGTDSQRGLGIRATVDDADMLRYDVAVKGKRVNDANRKFVELVNNVNAANIPNTPEMKPYRGYLAHAKKVVLAIQEPNFIKGLLPPPPEDEG